MFDLILTLVAVLMVGFIIGVVGLVLPGVALLLDDFLKP